MFCPRETKLILAPHTPLSTPLLSPKELPKATPPIKPVTVSAPATTRDLTLPGSTSSPTDPINTLSLPGSAPVDPVNTPSRTGSASVEPVETLVHPADPVNDGQPDKSGKGQKTTHAKAKDTKAISKTEKATKNSSKVVNAMPAGGNKNKRKHTMSKDDAADAIGGTLPSVEMVVQSSKPQAKRKRIDLKPSLESESYRSVRSS